MKKLKLIALVFLAGTLSCSTATDNSGSEETTTEKKTSVSEEEKAINQIIKNVYAALSFEEGSKPNYEEAISYFFPGATLYDYSGDSVALYSIGDYLEGYKAGVEAGEISSAKVIEAGGITEYFGKIAHRISVNADYFNGSEEAERGVNSFQLIKVDGKWLINSLIWDVEKEGQAIPDKYLME